MKITKQLNGTELSLLLEGNLDTTTAPEFAKVINESLSGVSKLIVDLEKVSYVSSAGLRVILVAFKAMKTQGEMIVCHVSQDVMDIFTMTGFTDILNIEK